MAMIRCAMCDAPNVTDREICWRCLRDLAERADTDAASLDRTPVVEAALGRDRSRSTGASTGPGEHSATSEAVAPSEPGATGAGSEPGATGARSETVPAPAPRAVAPVAVRPDPTPIKVVPLRPSPPAIMPMSWPSSGEGRHGRRRVRSVAAGSLAVLLTLALGIVVVSGILPGAVDDQGSAGPLTAQLVDASEEPSAAPLEPAAAAQVRQAAAAPVERATLAPIEAATVAPIAAPTLAPVEAATLAPIGAPTAPPPVVDTMAVDPVPTQVSEPTRRPRPTTAAAPDPVGAGDLATPQGIEASTSGMRARKDANAFTCANDAPPIRDPYDRTWRVSKISYTTQPGFERVILHLRRIGEASPSRGTSAIARRVPTSRLGDFPEDVRPEKKKRRLLRVDLSGVPQAPDLRAFRLMGLGQIGELSLLPGKKGRTALLAIDGDACYRLRVPAWNPSADANASQAEVVIDIKGR
jgi:hypothetical protein